ncbi:MAG: sigma-54 dependent transcriptional regulator [Acidobacteria bacterium]|nr:sigma-54 dependent transcriptional regulator [Acidobacteriota bacterium]
MDAPNTILVVDDDLSLRTMLAELLRTEGHAVVEAADGRAALEAAGREAIDLALLDLRLPDTTGLELLPKLRDLRPEASVVMLTAAGSIEQAVAAMRLGADNFVQKPIEPAGLFAIVAKGLETAALRRRARRTERLTPSGGAALLGESPEWRGALALAESVAPRDTTVLLTGPTGTGKGMLARRIHELSPRRREPFVELNCAGLSRELTESELFGHERGAFTGATERKLGLFEAADGGTLFLDEIGELDPSVQAKLLKVLEDRRYRRLGGRDLKAEAAAGRFREDLFFRLNVFTIALPRLADRPEDVLPLAIHFLSQFRPGDDPGRSLTDEAAALLLDYGWPGNVRELRNVMERASIVCPPGAPVGPQHLPALEPEEPGPLAGAAPPAASGTAPATIEDAERTLLERALRERKAGLRVVAKELGISRGTLYRKARKYGIDL